MPPRRIIIAARAARRAQERRSQSSPRQQHKEAPRQKDEEPPRAVASQPNVQTPHKVNESNTHPEPPQMLTEIEAYLATPAAQRTALLLQFVLVLTIIAALTIQQLQFKDTWEQECDYSIKIWSTVWLARALLQFTTLFVVTLLVMKKMAPGLVTGLRRFQSVIQVFKCAWFLYGIKPVLVDEKCDQVSKAWGKSLWWIEFATIIAPCVCLCCIAPCCLVCLMKGAPSVEPEARPTPEDVRNQLQSVPYSQIQLSGATTPSPEKPTPEAAMKSEANIYPDMASTITGIPFPDISQIKRASGANVQQGEESCCAVCFCQLKPEDPVVVMPCKHTFHSRCIMTWLAKSQECPVCRENVVQAVEREEKNKTAPVSQGTTDTYPSSSSTSPTEIQLQDVSEGTVEEMV